MSNLSHGGVFNIKIPKMRESIIQGVKITNKQQEFILQNYQKFSQQEIANKICCSQATIHKYLKKYNLKRQNPRHKYSLNHNYFDQINTHNKAYIIGFTLADGMVRIGKDNSHILKFDLSSKDICILKFIKKELDIKNTIKNYSRRKNNKILYSSILYINSKHLVKILINIGIKPRKTWSDDIPNVPKKFRRSFLLGFFDGDGTIYFDNTKYKAPKIKFPCFVEKFLIKLRKSCNLDNIGGIYKDKENAYKWIIQSKKQCIDLYHYMYGNTDFYLKRKHDKFLEFIN